MSVGTWHATGSLVRAALGSAAISVLAVTVGRPDLLVLAAPLLVAAVAGVRHRPSTVPSAHTALGHTAVREGEGTTVQAVVTTAAEVEHVLFVAKHRSMQAYRPPSGIAGATVRGGEKATLELPVASLRWGRRPAGDGLVAATSGWGGYRWGPVDVPPQMLTTLPLPGHFDAAASVPHPIGLVGTNPARRTGDGSEFASIRPFYPGDRLRRVQWRVSLRTGELHVTSTLAEEDSSILLIVDAVADLGVSGDGPESVSSLDVAVRAAGAMAEHYLRHGDRVGLRVLGSTRHNTLPVRGGNRHLRRVLDTLAMTVPGTDREVRTGQMQFGITEGTVAVVLSPMLSAESISATLGLARRGVDVVVVDTVPEGLRLGDGNPRLALAWRMRRLERDALLRSVQAAGVPVVAWRGPGTLDEVLRRLARRGSTPTAVRR